MGLRLITLCVHCFGHSPGEYLRQSFPECRILNKPFTLSAPTIFGARSPWVPRSGTRLASFYCATRCHAAVEHVMERPSMRRIDPSNSYSHRGAQKRLSTSFNNADIGLRSFERVASHKYPSGYHVHGTFCTAGISELLSWTPS
ncbi:hypothetical protein NEOLEDRAFT_452024 [Neolentinus lepideus HHB14362 ss-1]|uniref:Uncharacterized protein n=1 Tax=Neolentinus lepideus HHB14362 ss-1 TaxID=1314782 RepID=A0A165RU32_9AGAM|nr:hypothetical protein NEOLEDRAFT_452024 [Neolentinus lepideus HHB14362 ss-1]